MQMRCLVIEIRRLSPKLLSANSIIAVVVYDPMTQAQLVRIDKTCAEAMKERFLVRLVIKNYLL